MGYVSFREGNSTTSMSGKVYKIKPAEKYQSVKLEIFPE